MKPVAWMSPDGKVSTTEGKLFYIPLYTAPRELSDELFNAKIEILRLQDEVHWLTNHPYIVLVFFAKMTQFA